MAINYTKKFLYRSKREKQKTKEAIKRTTREIETRENKSKENELREKIYRKRTNYGTRINFNARRIFKQD